MGSQKQTGETSVLESVCSTARERYALRQDYIMMGDDDADLGIIQKKNSSGIIIISRILRSVLIQRVIRKMVIFTVFIN